MNIVYNKNCSSLIRTCITVLEALNMGSGTNIMFE